MKKIVFESLAEFLLESKKARKHNPKAALRNRGDVVFPAESKSVNDDKDHFPINSLAQARNALARVNQYTTAPSWYNGSLETLVKRVVDAVHKKYPSIKISEAAKKPGKN